MFSSITYEPLQEKTPGRGTRLEGRIALGEWRRRVLSDAWLGTRFDQALDRSGELAQVVEISQGSGMRQETRLSTFGLKAEASSHPGNDATRMRHATGRASERSSEPFR
jgi:hypothetical protein